MFCDIITNRECNAQPCCSAATRPKGGKKMRKYEIMYIIRPNLLEEDRKKLIESLNDIFSSMDSEVTKVNEWGMRDLAYEIQDFKKGYYVVLDVKATEEARAEFDRIIRLKEEVIRYLIIKDER